MLSQRSKLQISNDNAKFFGKFKDDFNFESSKDNNVFDLGVGNIRHVFGKVKEIFAGFDSHVETMLRSLNSYPAIQSTRQLSENLAYIIEKETGKKIDWENIILTNGGYESIATSAFTFCEPNDKVFFAAPSFPYWGAIERQDAAFACHQFISSESYKKSYGDTFKRMAENDKRIKCIIVNSPHNPMSSSIEKGQCTVINKACEEKNLVVLLDDVYRAFSKEWIGKHFSQDRIVIIDSFSKRFAMPGLRFGFTLLPKEMVDGFRSSFSTINLGISHTSQFAANYFLKRCIENGCTSFVVDEIKKRQSELSPFISKLEKLGIKSTEPEGGMYRLLELDDFVSNTRKTIDEIHKYITDNGIILLKGSAFFPNNYFANKDKCQKNHVSTINKKDREKEECINKKDNNNNANKQPNLLRISVGGDTRMKEAGEKLVGLFEKMGSN